MVATRIILLVKISSIIIQTSLVVALRFISKTSPPPPFIVTHHISQMLLQWQITLVLLIVVLMVIVIFTHCLFVGLVIQLVMLLKKLNYHRLLNRGVILVVMGQLKMVIMKLRLLSINLNILT